eukprot:5545701-Amphidinium_carterae.1
MVKNVVCISWSSRPDLLFPPYKTNHVLLKGRNVKGKRDHRCIMQYGVVIGFGYVYSWQFLWPLYEVKGWLDEPRQSLLDSKPSRKSGWRTCFGRDQLLGCQACEVREPGTSPRLHVSLRLFVNPLYPNYVSFVFFVRYLCMLEMREMACTV